MSRSTSLTPKIGLESLHNCLPAPASRGDKTTINNGEGSLGSDPEKRQNDHKVEDSNLVDWNDVNDLANPKNWSLGTKWATTAIVSSFSFISPVSSSIIAPALTTLDREFHITNAVESQIMLSIFLLAFAIGPLVLGPLSEVYGRSRILQGSNIFYLIFNTACGGARNQTQMTVFRFLAGLGGSAPLVVAGGVMGDLFESKDRGKAVAVYSLMPLLAPALGPVAGGFITNYTTWRWTFYAISCLDGLVLSLGFLCLRETYKPVLLQRKKAKLIKATGNSALYTKYDDNTTLATKLRIGCTRPFILLFTQPIIQALAAYMAIAFGLSYLVLSTYSSLFVDVYHESISISGLNYISLAVGSYIGAQTSAFVIDRVHRRMTERGSGHKLPPESRIPFILVGVGLVVVGILWYGWSAEAREHWIMPDVGIAVFSAGSIVVAVSVQAYILDTYARYAASALAAVAVLRSLGGFAFPLFAPDMYRNLGYGWGNTLLAGLAAVVGFSGSLMLWRYGSWLRAKSPFATDGL